MNALYTLPLIQSARSVNMYTRSYLYFPKMYSSIKLFQPLISFRFLFYLFVEKYFTVFSLKYFTDWKWKYLNTQVSVGIEVRERTRFNIYGNDLTENIQRVVQNNFWPSFGGSKSWWNYCRVRLSSRLLHRHPRLPWCSWPSLQQETGVLLPSSAPVLPGGRSHLWSD